MPGGTLGALAEDVEQLRKRQRIHRTTATTTIELLESELQKSLDSMHEDPSNVAAAVGMLFSTVKSKKISETAMAQQKTLHSAISKLGKSIDKTLDSIRSTNASFDDEDLLQEAVVEQLCRSGHFDIATLLAEESSQRVSLQQAPYGELHKITQALQNGDIVHAMRWAAEHRTQLQKMGSSLEFLLHRLQCIRLLQGGDAIVALKYLRQHLAPFATEHISEVQQLTGALMYVRDLKASPYAELCGSKQHQRVLELFAREACAVMGLPKESPLHLGVLAGCRVLPASMRMLKLMQSKGIDWASLGAGMQTELQLGPDLQFHSVFICPISREQSSPENPPVWLPCGHVICRQSMMKLVRTNSRFKCPYCPIDVHMEQVLYILG